MTKICRFLNTFQTKIVIAPVLDDTLNLSKESLISRCLTSTSLLFIKRHDQFFILNRILTERKIHIFQNIASTTHITKGFRLQKMKTDFKKKKLPLFPAWCQSLPEKLRFSLLLQPRKTKKKSRPPFRAAP